MYYNCAKRAVQQSQFQILRAKNMEQYGSMSKLLEQVGPLTKQKSYCTFAWNV